MSKKHHIIQHYNQRSMRNIFTFLLVMAGITPVMAQQSVGIGTTNPDSHAVLDISSTKKGVFFPRLTTAEQATLT